MINRLRKTFFSVPVLVAVYVFALYLVLGFFALPAVVKWQAEKQVAERFGLQLQLGEVRFNPLRFEFEANDLRMTGDDGLAMLSFKRLWVDFELRSVLDRAWTVSQIALDSPAVNLSIEKDGQHNFSGLLAQLQTEESASQDEALPRFLVAALDVHNGRIDVSDKWLSEPMVAHVEPLSLAVRNLSSLPGQVAKYELLVRTSEGENLGTSGELNLAPLSSQGDFVLRDIQLATIGKGLSRLLSIDSPAGRIGLAARFDFGVDESGAFSGELREASLDIAGLSVSAPGGQSPLLVSEGVSLTQGVIDLDSRDVHFASFKLVSAQASAKIGADGSLDWAKLVRVSAVPDSTPAAGPADAPEETKTDQDKPWKLSVGNAEVADMSVRFSDESNRLQVDLPSINLDVAPTMVLAADGVRISLATPKVSVSGLTLQSGAQSLGARRVQVDAGNVELVTSGRGLALSVDQPRGVLAQIQLKSSNESLSVEEASIAADVIALDQNTAGMKLATSTLKLALSKLVARQGDDQYSLADAKLTTGALAVSSGQDGTAGAGLNVQVDDAASQLDLIDVSLKSVVELPMRGAVRAATLGAEKLHLAVADGPVDMIGEGLQAALSDTVLRAPDDTGEMLRLTNASLRGANFNLKDKTTSADALTLADGMAQIWLDAQGRVNGLGAASEDGSPEPDPIPPAPASAASAAESGWQVALATAQIDGLSIGFEDRHQLPPIALGLEAISARATGYSTVNPAPIPVEVKARLVSGGNLEASGSVQPDTGRSDLAIKVDGVELAPVQPYLSEFARLKLASGRLSGSGRLRYADPAGALVSYEGKVAVDQFLLEEAEPKRPFVSWDSVTSDDLILTVAPNRLDIGELRVVHPAGRLIIAEDQSINLTDVLRKDDAERGVETGAEADAAAETLSAGPADAARVAEATGEAFPVSIARVRVSDGLLEFADLSLRPQFGTRMHDLKGVITGLGSDPNQSAQVQLDAQVDTYGSAKIRGQISVAQPEKSTAIDMNFRNLEMTSLSPYVVKFAGYRVIGGQLTLDLQYRVDASALKGQNKIVLNQVELGERVESPGALDLPLDLALAILKDAKGVIDIELPVSGNLNDPQFDYGAVIGKAVGNLLGSIVTAPFRALGALFGGGEDEQLDTVDFEPGSATIAPHERQKLATVARALKERPALTLIVPPTYAAPEDSPVLKSRAVCGEIVRAMGVELAAGEDPGPIDTANQRVQGAIEVVFSRRYAPEVLAALKQRALESAAPVNVTPIVGAGTQAPVAQAAPPVARPAPAFYQTLVDRLLAEETVSDAALSELAIGRRDAIMAELASLGEIAPGRIVPGKIEANGEVLDQAVRLRLQLETGK